VTNIFVTENTFCCSAKKGIDLQCG